ncbi:MAG: hypothetical protein OXI43_02495 [Candidatus Poribacteria bacterium]|nr:hypothetical protein [Candidatus Poribacteria bacterium]
MAVIKTLSLSLMFAGGILIMLFGINGCSDMPYTGSMLQPGDVDKYLFLPGDGRICLTNGFETACLTLVPKRRDGTIPIIHIYPSSIKYIFYYEGVPILEAERLMDTTEIVEQIKDAEENKQPRDSGIGSIDIPTPPPPPEDPLPVDPPPPDTGNGGGQTPGDIDGGGNQQPPGGQQPRDNGDINQQPPGNTGGSGNGDENNNGGDQTPPGNTGGQTPGGNQQPPDGQQPGGNQQPPGGQQPPDNTGGGNQQPRDNGDINQQPPGNTGGSGNGDENNNGGDQTPPGNTGGQTPGGNQQPPDGQQPRDNDGGNQQPPGNTGGSGNGGEKNNDGGQTPGGNGNGNSGGTNGNGDGNSNGNPNPNPNPNLNSNPNPNPNTIPVGETDISSHYYYYTRQPPSGDGWLVQIYYPANYNGPRKLREDPEGYGFSISLNHGKIKDFAQTAADCFDYDDDGQWDRPCNKKDNATYSVQIYVQTDEPKVEITVTWQPPYSGRTATYTLDRSINLARYDDPKFHPDHTSQER